MKKTILILASLTLSINVSAKEYGNWKSLNINGVIYTHFVNTKLPETYESRGFSSINVNSPTGTGGSDFISKKAHLATIPYYQNQIDNYGSPRGEGKWKNYGTMGVFGFDKN